MTTDELLARTGAAMAAHLDGTRPLLSLVEDFTPDHDFRNVEITWCDGDVVMCRCLTDNPLVGDDDDFTEPAMTDAEILATSDGLPIRDERLVLFAMRFDERVS